MLRKTLFLTFAAILMVLATSSKAQAWYAYHYGYGPFGGVHYGYRYGYPYGFYHYGGFGGYHYGYYRRW